MLIRELLKLPEGATLWHVTTRMAEVFDYEADIDRLGTMDSWPSRDDVAADLIENAGRLKGDCDDATFCTAYCLHDLGLGARVVSGADETGAGHMVCEDQYGNVIDSRQPGRVLDWDELELLGYRSARMNALDFEEGAAHEWHFVKVDAHGRRDYS